MDVDVIATLDHLFGSLREAAFVAVQGRQRENPRQPNGEANKKKHEDRPAREPFESAPSRRESCFAHLKNAADRVSN